MDPRINLITLGVADVARATAFYEALGWLRSQGASQPQISFLQLGPLVLALWNRAELAADCGLPDPNPQGGFGGITLAHNVGSEDEVRAVLATAVAAGARVLRPPGPTHWGGFIAYFADPDGHPWEVAWNPFVPVDGEGMMVLPP